jgi:membrane protease YdiL (CAAX protease family)
VRIPGPEGDGPSAAILPASLAAAYAAFAMTFRGPKERFWQRMTRTGVALGSLALIADPSLRRTRIRPRDLALGMAAAAGLYGIFQVGDRAARRILRRGGDQIDQIYALRQLRPSPELAARLALVIGPAEELFWRGLLQRLTAKLHGRWPGAALTAGAYGGAHAITGNLTLVGAATVAGAYWSTLAAAGFPMAALIVSHVAWDVLIFLVAPTGHTS